MTTARTRLRLGLSLAALLATAGLAPAQKDEKAGSGEKKPATIEVLVPEYSKELKIEGKVTQSTGEKRTFVTPDLEPGKMYQYKIELLIEPNNYTKITRTREVTFKSGDKITVDLRKKDEKIPDGVVIRWVPTPKDIVLKMGELAKIGKNDIVYDLGCGDGIMIVTAVKELGAKKGVGIDRDPQRVKEANEAKEKAGIADKIDIRLGDILKLDPKDVADCTVLMLYLGDEMNIRLRPYLWKALKPGTRIVSHRFIMGDWKPDKTITVTGEDGDEYVLHVWTITGKEKDGTYPKKAVEE